MKEINPPVEIERKPHFKFVYVEHEGLANAKAAWEEIKDCDIILQEEVGLSEDEKSMWEKMVALATYKPELPEGARLREKFLSRKESHFGYFLIANAIESQKEFHFIDAPAGSPAFTLSKNASTFLTGSFILLRHGRSPEAVKYFEKSVEKYAESFRQRTKVILEQIHGLTQKAGYKWGGKKIGIAQGAGHEGTHDMFNQVFPGYNSEKILTTPMATMFLFLKIIKKRELFPAEQVDKTEIKRIMLSTGLLFPYLQVLRPNEKENDLHCLSDQIVSLLIPETVEEYWGIIENGEELGKNPVETSYRIAYTMAKNYGLEEPRLNR